MYTPHMYLCVLHIHICIYNHMHICKIFMCVCVSMQMRNPGKLVMPVMLHANLHTFIGRNSPYFGLGSRLFRRIWVMLHSLSHSLLSASFSLLRQYDASSDVRLQPVTQKMRSSAAQVLESRCPDQKRSSQRRFMRIWHCVESSRSGKAS